MGLRVRPTSHVHIQLPDTHLLTSMYTDVHAGMDTGIAADVDVGWTLVRTQVCTD